MITEPKRGTCGWTGKIDVNYNTSVHQKPHLKYHSCIDWREGESAPAQPDEKSLFVTSADDAVKAFREREAVPPAAETAHTRNSGSGTAMTAEQDVVNKEIRQLQRSFEGLGVISDETFEKLARPAFCRIAAHVREAAQKEIAGLQRGFVNIYHFVTDKDCDPKIGIGMSISAVCQLKEKLETAKRKLIEKTAKLENLAIETGEAKGLLQRSREECSTELRRKLAELEKALLALLAETCGCSSGDPNWHSSRCRVPKIEAALASLRAEKRI